MRAVLTIAGSDSIAGAGIQADLKTFAALGVYGTTAITAITAQNAAGIADVFPVPLEIIRSQIEAVGQELPFAAVKIGMLATGDITRLVAEMITALRRPNVVVDTVLTAGSPGRRTLLAPEAVEILKSALLPLATVVTPNTSEARALCGVEVRSLADSREAARRILDFGPRAVVVKGGHMEGPAAVDLLYDGRTFTEFSSPRSSFGSVHGTGCTFASAIAAGLALGDSLPQAVQRAKTYVTGAIDHSFELGPGARLLDHFWQHDYTQR